MAEILLINPNTGSWDLMSLRLPESLLAVASVPVARGYSVRLIDERVTQSFEADIQAAVGPETVLVGLTAITGEQIRHALRATRLVKRLFPHLPVCWGGVHATLMPEQTAEHPLIDYVVVGDGEFVFCELFERLRDKKPLDDLRGLVYRPTGAEVRSNAGQLEVTALGPKSYSFVRKNGAVDILNDLDSLPPIPYQLIDLTRYNVFYTKEKMLQTTLNTSRGCPFRCKFCSDPVINLGRWRGYSAQKVIEKVRVLHEEHGVGLIYFMDDYFPGSKKRFLEILEGLARFERRLKWTAMGIRADILSKMSEDELDLLWRSGCHSLEIGIETGNPRVLALVNKGETIEEMRIANQRLARLDIKLKYTIIVGFPGETDAEMTDTLTFAAELERTNPNAFCLAFPFMPIIGTPFYDQALAAGFKTPASLEEWAEMDFIEWRRHYASWSSAKSIRRIEAIAFTSYFHNANVREKFAESPLLRLAFAVYHPVAKWRFDHHYYDFFVEAALQKMLLALRKGFADLKALLTPGRPQGI